MRKSGVILMAEDDPDDMMLARRAFAENNVKEELFIVENGEELMNYLLLKGDYHLRNAPRPSLILLDLNMPKKDGREALAEIKTHPQLKVIPVVIFTTSRAEEDVFKTYNLGANSFITKPAFYEGVVEITSRIRQYWFDTATLPA